MGIANIINTSTSAGGGGGEIIRELVNSSDGQGLHFNGASSYISIANSASAEFGTSDFSLEFILNQTQASTSETYYFTAPYTGDNRMGLWYDKTNTTLKIFFRTSSNTHYDFGYDIAADFGTPTHFVVSADRSGNAVLYRNGSEVGSVNISGSSAVNIGDSNANAFHISANSASTALIGSLYRFRTFSKALSHDEVNTCFQRADVKNALKTNLLIDLDLAFANPTQSLMVQDRAGAADGTASASGVEQTQKIPQLNAEELRVAGSTPKIGVGLANTVTPAGKLHVHGADGDGYLRLSTDTTGATATDGARIGYNASDLRIQNYENSKIQFFTNNTTEALVIDSAGRLHVGSVSASLANLNISNTGGVGGGVLINKLNSGFCASGDVLGSVGFKGVDSANSNAAAEASIAAIAAETYSGSTAATDLAFYTKPTGTGPGSAPTERLRISSAGAVGISTSSPISPLTVDGADGVYVRHTDHPGIAFDDTNIADGSTPITYISGDGGALVLGRANRNSSTGRRTASSASVTISSAGLATFAAGVTVSGGFTTLGNFNELTIASGAVTATSSVHNIETEGAGATDYLDTINGGSTGTVLTLMAAHSSRTVVVEDGTNLKLAGDCTLDNIEDTITLVKNGSAWHEVSRSNNGA